MQPREGNLPHTKTHPPSTPIGFQHTFHLKNLLFTQDKFTVEQGQGKHSQPMRTDAGSSVSAHELLGADKMHIPALTCL